ncbi:MAG: histidinol-phosphatase [Eubacteriaceae bacterium]|nr:histidinol-phosphatase [Eubacteriaceae bacterium]
MSALRDYHMHTCFCDGKSDMESMVVSAVEKGLECVGIAVHSYTWFDESYCISRENIPRFISLAGEMKEKYAERIRVFCGVEQDFYSEESTEGFDYVIGSVHYLKIAGRFFPVDEDAPTQRSIIREVFDGDAMGMVRSYFDTVGDVYERTHCDIVGHFDLVTKFIEKDPAFDAASCEYLRSWKEAAEKLLPSKALFEINTGAISRGYRSGPYPSEDIISYLSGQGAGLILSSDAHSPEDIAYGFGTYGHLATAEFDPSAKH